MSLAFEPYLSQRARWPARGRHVLAQFTDQHIVVYQAYRPEIGRFAADNGKFGGAFSFSRMTWIKPNFLWMMYRSGWGTKDGQEVTLAIWLLRSGFETLMADAVASSYDRARFSSKTDWKRAGDRACVRLQWDPDHDPTGAPQERRAIQLGVRGRLLERMNDEWIAKIEDISELVAEQRGRDRSELVTPREDVYPVPEALCARIGLRDPDDGDA